MKIKKKAKILITGSTGFVGSEFHNRFNTTYDIRCINRRNFPNIKSIIQEFNPEFIIHLASETSPEVKSYNYFLKQLNNTIKPTVKIADNINKDLKLAIFFGSIEEYGLAKQPYKESYETKPETLYGMAKKISYLYVKEKLESLNKSYIWIRPSLIIGKKASSKRLIGGIIKDKNNFRLNNPNSIRDYIHINDVLNFLKIVINDHSKFSNQVINLTNEKYIKNINIRDFILKKTKMIKYEKKPTNFNAYEKYKVSSGEKLKKIASNMNFTNIEAALLEIQNEVFKK